MNKEMYFAALPADDLVSELVQRAKTFGDARADWEKRWIRNHEYYYNRVVNSDGSGIGQKGQHGEMTTFSVNQLRNFLLHIQNLITQTRPAYQARAINSDAKSLDQAKLANDLLDYYIKEKRLGDYFRRAVEYSLVEDSSYIKVEWDNAAGDEYAVDPNERPVTKGDLGYSNVSAWDVIFQLNGKNNFSEHDWVMTRSLRSRWDLVAQYASMPEGGLLNELGEPDEDAMKKLEQLRTDILGVQFEDCFKNQRPGSFGNSTFGNKNEDDLYVYEFYHAKTPSLKDGRYVLFVGNTCLYDGDLPYRSIPIYQISAGMDLTSPFGYSVINDLVPIQSMINETNSIISTNQLNFGVQKIAVARNSNVEIQSLKENLSLVKYDHESGPPPAPMQLTATAGEILNRPAILEGNMETISGINSVVRGNPESSLKSGTALALVQTQSVNFINQFADSYNRLMEDVGTATVLMLRDFASSERVISVVGKHNQAARREFTGDDLENINRMSIEPGNPLSKTAAGRNELATNLLNMGLIKTPEEYLTVITTGNVDPLYEGQRAELLLIRKENELLMEGTPQMAAIIDDHRLHIMEHKAVLADPAIRGNDALVKAALDHIQEHIKYLMDPNLLPLFATLGYQGLAGMAPPPGPQGPGPQNQDMMQDPTLNNFPPGVQEPNMPNPAQPPQM